MEIVVAGSFSVLWKRKFCPRPPFFSAWTGALVPRRLALLSLVWLEGLRGDRVSPFSMSVEEILAPR